jgi:hypothetical protein
VLDRGPKGVAPAGGSVRPGLHAAIGDRSEIVWWDSAALTLDVQEEISLRQQRILEADPDGAASAASEENYTRWKLAHDETLEQASRPSISVETVAAACRGSGGDDNIQVEVVARLRDGIEPSHSTLPRGDRLFWYLADHSSQWSLPSDNE